MRKLRLIYRLLRLLVNLVIVALDYFFTIKLPGKGRALSARAGWMERQCKRLLKVLNIEPVFVGAPPADGVLVSNHISYTDILVYGSRRPVVFISKSEVADWPVFGPFSKFAGTLYVRRDLRSDVLRVAAEMPRVIDSGVVLAFFPEGTSTGGDHVLPFRTPLLAPAVEHHWKITPAFLRYELEPGDGLVADEVAYWRDMVFGPHLLNLLSKNRIRAVVTYGEPLVAADNRKTLAEQLHRTVCELGGFPPSRDGAASKVETAEQGS